MYCKHCAANHLDAWCPHVNKFIDEPEEFNVPLAIAVAEAIIESVTNLETAVADLGTPTFDGDGGSFGGGGADGSF